MIATVALTPREQDVADLLKQGLSNKEIGQQLAIQTHTVKLHVSSILSKLRVNNRTAAVIHLLKVQG